MYCIKLFVCLQCLSISLPPHCTFDLDDPRIMYSHTGCMPHKLTMNSVQYKPVAEFLTGVQKIMHLIPANDSDFSLFHAQDKMNISFFLFHFVLNSSLTTSLALLYFHPCPLPSW